MAKVSIDKIGKISKMGEQFVIVIDKKFHAKLKPLGKIEEKTFKMNIDISEI